MLLVIIGGLLLTGCISRPLGEPGGRAQACRSGSDHMARVGEIQIAYRQYGRKTGPSMVLIGGTGQQLVDWPPSFIKALIGLGYRVTVFDSRDIGCSTHMARAGPPDYRGIVLAMAASKPPPVAYSTETLADDTKALLDAIGVQRAHIVGISGGAIVAEVFAAKYPQQTRSLTLAAPNSGNPKIPIPADPKRLAGLPAAPPASAPEADIVRYKVANARALQSRTYPKSDAQLETIATIDVRRSYDPDGLARQSAAALATPDLRSRLRTIRAPTAVLIGAEDPLIPLAMAQDVASAIPNARLKVIEGMGHDIPDGAVPQIVKEMAAVAR